MVRITSSNIFKKNVKRLNQFDRDKLEKQIKKIIKNQKVGKPLRYKRGEKSLYIKPFRLVYAIRDNEIILLKFGHRKNVYS